MRSKEVRQILGVTNRTLANYTSKGLLHPAIVNKCHYDYDPDEVYALVGKNRPRVNIAYSRVSLNKQKNDLDSQERRVMDFAAAKGIEISESITDVKSGMAFASRKGFSKLVDMVMDGKVGTVIVENRDRLARFGFELLETVFSKRGTRIVVMSDADNKTYEQELTDDLISIIHHYSMKSYSHRRRLNAAEKALKETKE